MIILLDTSKIADKIAFLYHFIHFILSLALCFAVLTIFKVIKRPTKNNIPAHLPDTRQLSHATRTRSSA